MMKRVLTLVPLLLLAAPASSQDAPSRSLEQTLMLRCSATLAIVSYNQKQGMPSTQSYPELETRSREYFVRSGARLMDELHLSREQLTEQLWSEVQTVQQEAMESGDAKAYFDRTIQPCLIALDASGL
jgi:hypothetical protein